MPDTYLLPTPASRVRLPSLLGQLGTMTALRDTLLLEQSLLQSLAPILNVRECTLYRLDEAGGVTHALRQRLSHAEGELGDNRVLEAPEELNTEIALEPHAAQLISEVRLLKKALPAPMDGRTMWAYPVFIEQQVMGAFVFARDKGPSAEETAVISGVLTVFSNYFNLLDASQRDHLTGLLNRQAMENTFDRIWSALPGVDANSEAPVLENRTPPQGYWLGVVDVDHFKRVNDTYGHVIGDEVLLRVSRLLSNGLRSGDYVFRYGGEEFVCILAAGNESSAKDALNRVRELIASHTFPQVGKITASAGLCQMTSRALPEEVVANADRALYHSKENGRNQVSVYEELVRNGVFKTIDYGALELF